MSARDHRVLVCGVGSVGERHIRNLQTLGCENIAVYRSRNLPMRTLKGDLPAYTDLAEALERFAPTVAFVTNPTALHLPVAMAAAEAGCHLFIEKPVSHTLQGLAALQETLEKRGRFAMVAYMLRFHPLLRQVKAWLDEGPEGTLGTPLHVRACWGEHVPDWHPWEDYRESYAVRQDLGGGPALTFSHEIDVLVWMLGRAERVVGMTSETSPLVTDCEHAVDMLIRFGGGAVANVHLDFWQRPARRSWELVGTRGRVELDIPAGTMTRWAATVGEMPPPEGAPTPESETLRVPEGFDRNDMFLEELRFFFAAIESGEAPSPGIAEAAESVRIAHLALQGELK